MKTIQELQAAVNELRQVCNKHGIVLIGTCTSEGIYGEISISEDKKKYVGWREPEHLDFNVVTNFGDENAPEYMLNAIGDLVE